ncbi:4-alpha-glucanotransferase [Vibrio sp. S4M6]|uniref:4-alpha-glucanotransferase n=1 Tax=Vibrio sinus TaxID=2946865 RepID=UPI00202A4623|nr:4-alpha-glucanotransferase [Vibrio sinus]MCL9781683.1 4-alpha-glucanotransferase [Vibrio sinus]
MINENYVKEVANIAGISQHYISAWGEDTSVKDSTIIKLLSAMGYDSESEEALSKSVDKKHKSEVLEPVLVLQQGQPVEIALQLGVSARESDFSWRLHTEQGDVLEGYLQSQIVRDDRANGGPLVFSISTSLPYGYHQLEVLRKRRKSPYKMAIICTPDACFKQEALLNGQKLWGPSIQLYTLRTQHNWGIGDFGDLKQLVSEIASRGGNFVGLNPIHALFPANPEAASPYSPSSRQWLNIMYIDVSSVPEFSLSKQAQQMVGSLPFQQRLQKARESHWVNYSEVSALKMSVLPLLYQEFKQRHLVENSQRAQSYLNFVEQGGESLLIQAAFDALHAQLSEDLSNVWGWPAFPEQYRRFDTRAVRKFIEQHEEEVNLYMYLQWVADCQVNEVQVLAKQKEMAIGLYRDLAVGVSDSGSEAWADEGNLVMEASTGAPPDILGPLGQNWGLPPLNPQSLHASAYDAYIKLLRANMRHCGALRIDHVLGLMRLWWVPKEDSAAEGAYVNYPVKDMLSILALESHRSQCSIIGEDLGTVPDEIVDELSQAGIHSYKVFFFERSSTDGGYISPKHYKSQSMATICTHDMPTLRGFWHCDDLKMGKELGLYPDELQLKRLFDDRLACKQAILDSVAWHGYLPEHVGKDATQVAMDSSLSEALQVHVAAGASALLSVQLEDWLEMDKPVNIPGTVDEYPNWRRKLTVNLDELFTRDSVNRLTEKLTQVRRNAGN